MTALALFADPTPPDLRTRGIDLRCCSCTDVDWPSADLVIADPPWSYVQSHGASRADNHYAVLPTSTIVEHLNQLVASRMALWLTWPLLPEWVSATTKHADWGWRLATGGAWAKSGEGDEGHYGQGYHWAGCSEPVFVYACGRDIPLDRGAPLRNAWVEPPGEHSRKPAVWMAQWLRRWVPEGGLVLDPYAGLASVAEAVLLAGGGRRYLGSEISPERHRAALGLLAQVRSGGGS